MNSSEVQADGSTRYLNDITSSAADFVVSEQDYNGTLRQVMFEQLSAMTQRLPPEVALRFLRIAMEFSDLPNKDEIAEQIRQITGEQDPNKEMTPEQAQQAQAQMQQQAEALDMQRQTAMLAMEEQRAKVALLNGYWGQSPNATSLRLALRGRCFAPQRNWCLTPITLTDIQGAGQSGINPELEGQIRQIQTQAAAQIDQLSTDLRKTQSELANRTLQIKQDSDTKLD